jgi:hypothetical protein
MKVKVAWKLSTKEPVLRLRLEAAVQYRLLWVQVHHPDSRALQVLPGAIQVGTSMVKDHVTPVVNLDIHLDVHLLAVAAEPYPFVLAPNFREKRVTQGYPMNN